MLKTRVLKNICFLLSSVMVILTLTACNEKEVSSRPYRNIKGSVLETQVLAANDDFSLSWDADANSVILRSLTTENYWSDILYNAFLEGSTNANGNSPIGITVMDTRTRKWDTIKSYAALSDGGKIVCKKLDNGIRVTYFFDTYEIAVPIDYQLREDSLLVTINTNQILENGDKYKLVSVSLTPFMCSASNEIDGAYLFVPVGSGALMYTANTPEGTRKYSDYVYGRDAAVQRPKYISNNEALRLPVFGAKEGDTALLGIIEQGAGAAVIEAQTSNKRIGYSNVGATFYVRGYDEFSFSSYATGFTILNTVTDDITNEKMSVAYYPLLGQKADYNGMAERYRRYLIDNNGLDKSKEIYTPYSVTLLGGTTTTVSTLGIAHSKLVSMTTFNQAEKIFEELKQTNGVAPLLRMMGYSSKGIKPAEIAGGGKYSSVYGTKEQILSLKTLCEDSRSVLFMDSDVIRYSKSGDGFSLNNDPAYCAVGNRIYHKYVTPLRQFSEDEYYILTRTKLDKAIESVIKKSEKYSINAISLSTLGSMAYSDYKYPEYYLRNGIEEEVTSYLTTLSDKGYITSVASANSYAACAADVLFDTTVENGDSNAFDEKIPFYQMVFHSYKPMYSEAINLSDNQSETIMRAVAYGMGFGYTLIHDYIDVSNDIATEKLYGMVYDDVKNSIGEALVNQKFIENYPKLQSSVFENYEICDDSITVSRFSNGMSVYANHSDKPVNSPAGEIEAYGYIITGGEN